MVDHAVQSSVHLLRLVDRTLRLAAKSYFFVTLIPFKSKLRNNLGNRNEEMHMMLSTGEQG